MSYWDTHSYVADEGQIVGDQVFYGGQFWPVSAFGGHRVETGDTVTAHFPHTNPINPATIGYWSRPDMHVSGDAVWYTPSQFDAPRYQADLASQQAAYDALMRSTGGWDAFYGLDPVLHQFPLLPWRMNMPRSTATASAMARDIGLTPQQYLDWEQNYWIPSIPSWGPIDPVDDVEYYKTYKFVKDFGGSEELARQLAQEAHSRYLARRDAINAARRKESRGLGGLLQGLGFVLGSVLGGPAGWAASVANMVGQAMGINPLVMSALSLGTGMLRGGGGLTSGFDLVGDMGSAAYQGMMDRVGAGASGLSFLDKTIQAFNALPAWQQQALQLGGKTALQLASGQKLDPLSLALGAGNVVAKAAESGAFTSPTSQSAPPPGYMSYMDLGSFEDMDWDGALFDNRRLFGWPTEQLDLDAISGDIMSGWGSVPTIDPQSARFQLMSADVPSAGGEEPEVEWTDDDEEFLQMLLDPDYDLKMASHPQFGEFLESLKQSRTAPSLETPAAQQDAPAKSQDAEAETPEEKTEKREGSVSQLRPTTVLKMAEALLKLLGGKRGGQERKAIKKLLEREYKNDAERSAAFAAYAEELLGFVPSVSEAYALDPRNVDMEFGETFVDKATGEVRYRLKPGTQAYFDALMQRSKEVLDAGLGLDTDRISAEQLEQMIEQLGPKREKDMATLTRALFARGLLGLITYQTAGVNLLTGEVESWSLPEGQGANPYFAAELARRERENYALARASRREAEGMLQRLLSTSPALFGQARNIDKEMLEAISAAGELTDRESDRKRRAIDAQFDLLFGPQGAYFQQLLGAVPAEDIPAALAEADMLEATRRNKALRTLFESFEQ